MSSDNDKLTSRAGDWLATGVGFPAFLTVLGVFDIAQRVAIRVGPDAHQTVVSHMAAWLHKVTHLTTGATFHLEGRENLVPGQNYIFVSNHQSMFDISMKSDFLRAWRPRFVSKKELARNIPGVSFNLREGGSACIDRKDRDQAHRAIEQLGACVRDRKWSAAIYLEGTRARDGRVGSFKAGGLRTLVRAAPGVPVVPVTSSGGARMGKHRFKPVVRNVSLSLRLHPPVMPPNPDDDFAFQRFVEELRRTIESGLDPQ